MRKTQLLLVLTGLFSVVGVASGEGRHPDLPDPDFDFKTFMCSWGGTTAPEFERFLKEARPEIVQIGFYGPLFHGYADNPKSTGYPMQLPVSGQREALAVQKDVNALVHRLGLKVVGHFQVVNVLAHPERWDDFLDMYDNHWPEDLLGPKPHADVRELLQRDAEGNVLTRKHYVDYVGLCTSSPHARQLLKQMLKLALESGLDGVVLNYNYRWECCCPYCQAAFKAYLAERFSPDELRGRFGIEDLVTHRFTRIAAKIPGYPEPDAAAIDWQAMHWGAEAFKRSFDEVFLEYGRSLKPDLIVATWNHLGHMSIGEERAFTPIDLWGRGENYFWYSGGYGPTDLAARKAGDGWLDCLYMREMSGRKPFMLGKYEPIRMRSSMAEGLATGGSGMGMYLQFKDPAGFEACASYMQFTHANRDLFAPRTPLAEVLLVFPRRAILEGHRDAMEAFKAIGGMLIDRHVLFDVAVDEKLDGARLKECRLVVVPDAPRVAESALTALRGYVAGGGTLLLAGAAPQELLAAEGADGEAGVGLAMAPGSLIRLETADPEGVLATLTSMAPELLVRVEAPWTLRVCGYRDPGRLLLHLVNFNRDEAAGAELKGPSAECPLATGNVTVRLPLRAEARVKRVSLYSPDSGQAQRLRFKQTGHVVQFTVPDVLVYGIVEVRLGRRWFGFGRR